MGRKANPGGLYAVAIGHRPGIYGSWDEAQKQVAGFRNARHKKFQSREEALAFIKLHNVAALSNLHESQSDQAAGRSHVLPPPQVSTPLLRVTGKMWDWPIDSSGANGYRLHTEEPRHSPLHLYYYAVAKGRVSGVYMTWKEAEAQVKDMYSAKYKKFSTKEEAQQYVDDYQRSVEAHPSDPHPMDPSTLIAFCDGSAVKNGEPGCKAGWGIVFPHNPEWNNAAPLAHGRYWPSNNRAEYTAAIEVIKRANLEDPAKMKPLYICTDSSLLRRSMTEWVPDWKQRGWIKADGLPVRNQDLLKILLKLQGERRIIWKWVKAHTNRTGWWSKWNDLADRMAREQTHNQPAYSVAARGPFRSGRNDVPQQMARQRSRDRPSNPPEERRVRPRLGT